MPIAPLSAGIIENFAKDPEWGTVRPPLVDLTPAECEALGAALREVGFTMPGLATE